MWSKYHHNAIITGYIDSYCLVCESHLRSEDDINIHIAKPIHSKNLDATIFVEKFKFDHVRKVKKGYFCEFCNILLSTAAKVGLHVVEEKHINKRGTQLLKRVGNNIAFFDILINEKAWNGLIDDTCAICNTEFNNELIHKTETAHVLNLVQNKVEFCRDNSNYIYRKIDDDSFQCLTCNMVLANYAITSHFDEAQHKKSYDECLQACNEKNYNVQTEKVNQEAVEQKLKPTTVIAQEKPIPVKTDVKQPTDGVPKKTEVKKPTDGVPKKTEVKKPTDGMPKKTDTLQETSKKEIPVTNVKKQETVREIPIFVENTENVDIPKKAEIPKLEKVASDIDEMICKALNTKDYITSDENGRKWCLLCDWTIDSAIVHNHVNGRHHKTMLKMHKERLQNKKQSHDSAEINCTKGKDACTKVEKEENQLEQENKSKIIDSVLTYQNNDININFVSNTAMCKKCLKYLEYNYKIIESHIEEHKKTPPKKESLKPTPISTATQKIEDAKKTQAASTQKSDKKAQLAKTNDEERAESRASSVASNKETDEEIEKFAKAHDLAYNRSNSKVYCRVCDSRVPSSLKNMKEHIAGLHHKNKASKWFEQKQNKPPVTIKKPMKEFIKNVVGVDNDYIKDVVINERYCINIFSFMMFTCMGRLRCEPCDVDLNHGDLDEHKTSPDHKKAMCDTVVVASMESEFIREVRLRVFHCGYCNVVCEEEELLAHLASTVHREARSAGSWRLQQYLPELMQQRLRKRVEMEMLMMLSMLAGDIF